MEVPLPTENFVSLTESAGRSTINKGGGVVQFILFLKFAQFEIKLPTIIYDLYIFNKWELYSAFLWAN